MALSDSVGRVVEKYQYAVYGNPQILNQNNKQLTESKYGNPYMFTGRRFDTETRLYYYRARYYSTEIGRFLQVDAIGYADSMNLYIYVGNNPIVLIDPSGLCGESSWTDSFWRGTAEVLDGMPNAVGLSLSGSWVNPLLERIPFLEGYANDVYGWSLVFFEDGRVNLYSYTTFRGEHSTAGGLDTGGTFEGFMAWGEGPWEGYFTAGVWNALLFTGSHFESPSGNWKGDSFGGSLGVPVGMALETTHYKAIAKTDLEETMNTLFRSGIGFPANPLGR